MQTSTHQVTIGSTEVRKQFVAGHDTQADREWACVRLLAEHAPVWRRARFAGRTRRRR